MLFEVSMLFYKDEGVPSLNPPLLVLVTSSFLCFFVCSEYIDTLCLEV